MEFINNANGVLAFFTGLVLLLTGGVASFFIIRSQMTKVLQSEVNIYKGVVERLEGKVKTLETLVINLSDDNKKLVNERDYLRGLITSALATSQSVTKSILETTIKEMDKKGGDK